ncbi:MAG: hypothetical protein HYU36_14310 [Planctomycetes bacterium]|nr:hypothetical protein [Planctomycetota bacterium]
MGTQDPDHRAGTLPPRLAELFLRPVPETPENRRYQGLLDEAVEAQLKDFDFDRGLLFPSGQDRPAQFPDHRAEWPLEERHRLANDPGYYWYYGHGRGSAALLGQMAFCYRQPLSRHFRSERFLEGLRQGFRAYRGHQLPSGEFAFCPVRYSTLWGTHEMAWRLEPLLYAYWWMGRDLPEGDRVAAEGMLQKGAEFLLPTLCDDPNNRGCVWSALIQLCGLWLGEERFLEAARRVWNVCKPNVLNPSGQVTEQGGPDANYSYTAFSYVFLYWLYSADASLDDAILRALQWFTLTHTRSGYPFEGTSSRKRIVLDRPRADLLPALILCSRREPYFRVIAERILEEYRSSGRHVGGHMVSPLIWMMLLGPGSVTTPEAVAEPAWHRESILDCRTDLTRYSLIRKPGYQTSVTLRSLQPMKGLQTWACGDEPPIVHPGLGVCSGTRAWGIDTASMNVSTRPMAANFYDQARGADPAPWLSYRQEHLWTHYLFTALTTLVVLDGKTGRRATTWALNRAAVPVPLVRPGVVEFPGRRGRLHYLGDPPRCGESVEAGVWRLDFDSSEELTVFAFSDDSFRLLEWDWAMRRLAFEDASGRFRFELAPRPVADPSRTDSSGFGLRGL